MSPATFQLRGVVEGFYGVYYTFPERNDLIRFLGSRGYNYYLYGPKNDRQHRARWWQPYPDEIMEQFAETLAVAREAGVTFCYAIAPISYASDEDYEHLTAKLRAFYDLGVRDFSVLVDDLTPDSSSPDKSYMAFAELHVAICNRLYDWLQTLGEPCTLSMCPTDYHGKPPFSHYLRALGEGLRPEIDIFYTGPEICSPEITVADVEAFAATVGRPPLLWDNYPVNDLAMRSELHLGPIRGRDADLGSVTRGVLVNPMIQAEASKIALQTYADFMRNPRAYDPQASWERALLDLGGQPSFWALRLFAAQVRCSIFDPVESPTLTELTEAALAALQAGEPCAESAAVQSLAHYLTDLDEATYALKNRMRNLRLRVEFLPWIEALEDWLWMGRRALAVIEKVEAGAPVTWPLRQMDELLDEIERHAKRVGGTPLLALAEYARERAAQQRPAAPVEARQPEPVLLGAG